MKRYAIEARRKAKEGEKPEAWTAWAETDDIGEIQRFTDGVRAAGYEPRVMDYKVAKMERLVRSGNLIYCKVCVGETVSSVVREGDEYVVRDWVVEELIYNGRTWYAVGGDNYAEVGSRGCLKKKYAHMTAKRLTEELAWKS